MHILFALPGLHRVERGAEVAFESIAHEIAARGRHRVTLAGSGQPIAGRAYDFKHVSCVNRERFEAWPKLPFVRSDFMYEDLTFGAALTAAGTFGADLTLTCSYPYTSWALRRPRLGRARPAHVFVTQNGDWPAQNVSVEARLFRCEGLVCTNPIYHERNQDRWFCDLIPNGLDPERFSPGPARCAELGLPTDRPLILMVSALEPGKRVLEAMRAVALVEDACLVVAGDGPLRRQVDELAAQILPGRFMRGTFGRDKMPDLYRSADLFLHTKIEESFGNVYIEALASGLPIVAHADDVTRWILREHAVLVDTNSTAATADAIRRALAGPRPEPSVAEWARKQYAWAEIAARYEHFFETVLDRKSGAQPQETT